MHEPKLEFIGPFVCGGGHTCRIMYEPHDGDPINVNEHPGECSKAGTREVPGFPVQCEEKKGEQWTVVHTFELTRKVGT